MPIIAYNLLREILSKQKGSVTTKNIINHVAARSPRNLERLVSNMIVLEKAGFIKKRFDKKANSYVWELSRPDLENEEILEKYPELYEQTLYGEESVNGVFKKRKK